MSPTSPIILLVDDSILIHHPRHDGVQHQGQGRGRFLLGAEDQHRHTGGDLLAVLDDLDPLGTGTRPVGDGVSPLGTTWGF